MFNDPEKSPQSHDEAEPTAPTVDIGITPVPSPAAVDLRWCESCQTAVVSIEKGQCPRCRKFLPGNRGNPKNPLNEKEVHRLTQQFIAEYRPAGTFRMSQCTQLARVTERLKHIRAGTPEYLRLVSVQTELATQLEAARSAPAPEEPVEEWSLERARKFAVDVVTQIAELQRIEAEDELRRAEAEVADTTTALHQATSEQPPPDPEPEPCPFCRKPFDACTMMRTTRPDVWAALHHGHPDEVARRAKERTAEMMGRVGQPHPWDQSL